MDDSYLDKLKSLLEKDDRLVSEDGRLLKAKIAELARGLDSELIKLLLKEASIKKLFFKKIDSVLVFDKDKFVNFVENEAFLADSYTAYKNKIGLGTDRDNFTTERNEVVLNWPYKDCVLEGGQDREDQKRDEIFWNEILGADQRDVLLAPKVLTGFKRYDKDGEHEVTDLKETDNLIIKGNNLLALYTLINHFGGRIKLIYIDPPYNTGNDGFNYNDSFNHSTWLTFMKNRITVAKELLSDDGSIFLQCDENESHYLKVLLDEIFGRDNFMNEIVWRYRTYQGQVKDYFPKKHDIIFWYKKENRPKFKLSYQNNKEDTVDYKRWQEFINKSGQIIYPYYPKSDSRFTAYLEKWEKLNGKPQDGDVIYDIKGYIVDDVWEDIKALDPKNKTERTGFKGGQKPEELIQRIINSVTEPGDIVLDYHLGSGTTAAVAHKMNRRYIGIEQLDYGDNDGIARLKKVIEGDKGGVSLSVSWHGGGSFVYTHLKNDVNVFIETVKDAKSNKELIELLNKVKNSNFLSYRVDQKKLQQDEFSKISLDQQKHLLIELVDKNKLYVNCHDIDDQSYKIDENTKKLNRWLQSKS